MTGSTQAVNQWGPMWTAGGVPFGTCHATECKQQFSLAYTYAVVARARCTVSEPRSDVECVDYTVRQAINHRRYSSTQVDVQMKCTEQDVLRDDGVHFELKRDHYDKLRDVNTYNRKILVVLLVPDLLSDWLTMDTDAMVLRRCAYWTCIEGAPEITTKSKTIILPRSNVFDVEQLLGILQRIGDGGKP